jgi:signal transduction histidine kinase
LERIVQPAGSNQPVLIQLAIDEEEIRRARAEFGTWMALFLGVLWALLSLAAWFQVQLGLRPLARLQYELAALRHNAAERLSADYPSEVEPLTQAINDLAGAREGDVKRARQRAADLAHGMKTPLAALAAQSRLIREGDGDPRTAADGLDRAIAAAGAAVEAELARARAAASRHARHDAQVAPQAIVQGLVLVLERTDKGMTLDYDLEFPEDLRVRVSAEDLSEIMGPLLENAVRFARRSVRVTGQAMDEKIALAVEDDGPGIPPAIMMKIFEPFFTTRIDQGGTGLGLATVQGIIAQSGGHILAESPPGGGTRFTRSQAFVGNLLGRNRQMRRLLGLSQVAGDGAGDEGLVVKHVTNSVRHRLQSARRWQSAWWWRKLLWRWPRLPPLPRAARAWWRRSWR